MWDFFLYLCARNNKVTFMNVEEIRDFCLSLGADVEEKLPFTMFKNGEGVLVFYVCGHMFCFFDLNDFQVISLCAKSNAKTIRFHGRWTNVPSSTSVSISPPRPAVLRTGKSVKRWSKKTVKKVVIEVVKEQKRSLNLSRQIRVLHGNS